MLSNHLHNGVETAKLLWSRLPNAEDDDTDVVVVDDEDGVLKHNLEGFDGVESLDYEVIENYAYRQEQVSLYYSYSLLLLFVLYIQSNLLLLGNSRPEEESFMFGTMLVLNGSLPSSLA